MYFNLKCTNNWKWLKKTDGQIKDGNEKMILQENKDDNNIDFGY